MTDNLYIAFFIVIILIILFAVVSILFGLYANKTYIGVQQLRKFLKKGGIDPNQFSTNQLRRAADNALSIATWSGNNIGKYDATEYVNSLQFWADIIITYVNNHQLDSDQTGMIKYFLEEPNIKQTN